MLTTFAIDKVVATALPPIAAADQMLLDKLVNCSLVTEQQVYNAFLWWCEERRSDEALLDFLIRQAVFDARRVPKGKFVDAMQLGFDVGSLFAIGGLAVLLASDSSGELPAQAAPGEFELNVVDRVDRWFIPRVFFGEPNSSAPAGAANALDPFPECAFTGFYLTDGAENLIRMWPEKSYRIGSAMDNDVILMDESVSPTHASLAYLQGGYVLKDQTSTTGTYVNGDRISERRLQDNDLIRVGLHTFRYLLGEEDWLRELFNQLNPPARPPTIAALGESINSMTFGGDLTEISLADLLQFLGSTRKTGTLKIFGSQVTGNINILDGAIIYADWGSVHGNDAVYHMISLKTGKFRFTRETDRLAQRRNVSSTTVMLIMEALRRIDEKKRHAENTGEFVTSHGSI